MVEPTRVPLQPIKQGSLAKLWAGIVVVLLVAAGAAWWAAPHGVKVTELVAGSGPHPAKDDVVFLDYVGKLPNGTVFDQSRPLNLPVQGILPEGTPMPVTGTIAGFSEGLQKMQAGGKYELFIPAAKAYGAKPPANSPIPPNSDLTFDVTIHAIMPEAEAEQRFQMLQQMMQSQQGAQGGAPGGSPSPGAAGGTSEAPPPPQGQ
jgi:FKBP-type peptidyl-prolyl cis-trans isomerase FkpA